MENKKLIIAVVAVVAVIAIAISVFLTTKNTKAIYTISFNTDGGEKIVSQKVEEGKTATKPNNPAKDGYEFLGWYLNNKSFDFTTPIEEDLTLEAKWKEVVKEEKPNVKDEEVKEEEKDDNKEDVKEEEEEKVTKYTVKFDSKGGSSVASQTVEKNKKATKPANPTLDGYTFKGWYLGSTKYDFSKKVTKNITLTAKWEKVKEEKPTEPNTPVTPDTPDEPYVPVTPEVKEYTVTFNTDGGSSVKAQTVKENEKATKPGNPTKQSNDSKVAYIFKGWYVDGKEFDFSTKITKDINVTAKWDVLKIEEQDVPNSVANEVMIYLELNNVKVAGTIQMTSVSGKTVTVNVPATGVEKTKGTYTSLSNPKVK